MTHRAIHELQQHGAALLRLARDLQLARDGWSASALVTSSEAAAFQHAMKNDVLRATFHRSAGKNAFGQPGFGPVIELGTVRATGDATPITLRLPAR